MFLWFLWWGWGGAPGEEQSKYKVYKNDVLGFSLKYPKDWFIEATPLNRLNRAYLLFELMNFDPTCPNEIPLEELVDMDCSYIPINDRTFSKDIEEIKDRIKDFQKNHLDIKSVEVISNKNGAVLLLRGKGISKYSGEIGQEYEVGYIYIPINQNRNIQRSSIPANEFSKFEYLFVDPTSDNLQIRPDERMEDILNIYVRNKLPIELTRLLLRSHVSIFIELFPMYLPADHRGDFIKILKSIEIY